MGGRILRRFHHLKVDVHNPDITVTVEVRDRYAFVRGNNLHGAGGMPTGHRRPRGGAHQRRY